MPVTPAWVRMRHATGRVDENVAQHANHALTRDDVEVFTTFVLMGQHSPQQLFGGRRNHA